MTKVNLDWCCCSLSCLLKQVQLITQRKWQCELFPWLSILHVSNWWPAGQMWPAMSFYVDREALNFKPQLAYFFGTVVVLYLFTKANDVFCHVITLLF